MIITGGSSGIGLAIAKHYAREGFNLSVIARNEARLAEAKQQLAGLCIKPAQIVETFKADVTSRQQIESAISRAVNLSGIPDILVTSAGAVAPGYFNELPVETFESMIAVNYLGTVYAVKAVEPMMRRRGKGHIVMISSGAGLIGIYGYSAYSPSKFAVRGFAEVLRAESEPYGIHVSVVYPPDTETPQLEEDRRMKPRETAVITENGGVMSADDVAKTIIRSVRRKKFIITPGYPMTLLGWLHSLIGPLLYSWFKFQTKKAQAPHNK